MVLIDGRFLVGALWRRHKPTSTRAVETSSSTPSLEDKEAPFRPILLSDVPLSFWGGIDPLSGIVIDTSHPLAGECVSGCILCLPSGRGSCTASQVLLELIRNDKAPRAIVLRDIDGLASVGALIAQEIFHCDQALDIICLGATGYAQLMESTDLSKQTTTTTTSCVGCILPSGQLQVEFMDPSEVRSWKDQTIAFEATGSYHAKAIRSPPPLDLSDEEQRLLNACPTEAERMALRVIFRYTQIVKDDNQDDTLLLANAEAGSRSRSSAPCRYIPIAQAHIDGCTYIGPGGLEFVQRLVQAQGQVKVPTTLNSVSTDRRQWQALGVPEDYARQSIALGDAYLALNCQPSFTCAPYLLPNAPTVGQDIAWGESNAVVYANSVLGARTEKYADYLDICCALAGFVPAVGVHVPARRQPRVVLDATIVLRQIQQEQAQFKTSTSNKSNSPLDLDLLFPTLGHVCGTLSDGQVPLLLGLDSWTVSRDNLKALCAAFGTTSSSPLIHIAGITPEVQSLETVSELITACGDQIRSISLQDLTDTFNILDSNTLPNATGSLETVDLVALGNPHLSVTECRDLAELIRKATTMSSLVDKSSTTMNATNTGTTAYTKPRIMACMSRAVHADADQADVQTMQDFGVEFVFDTCWCMLLDAPVIPNRASATILTNSGKYAHYGPGLTKRNFRLGSMADCIQAAQTGVYPRRLNAVGSSPLSFLSRSHRSIGTNTDTGSRYIRSFLNVVRKWL